MTEKGKHLDERIANSTLRTRVKRALEAAGFETVRDLVAKQSTCRLFLATRDLGYESAMDVGDWLAQRGCYFGMGKVHQPEVDASIKRVQGELAKARKEWRRSFKFINRRCVHAEGLADALRDYVAELKGYLRRRKAHGL